MPSSRYTVSPTCFHIDILTVSPDTLVYSVIVPMLPIKLGHQLGVNKVERRFTYLSGTLLDVRRIHRVILDLNVPRR